MRDSYVLGEGGRTLAKATPEEGWSPTTSTEGDILKSGWMDDHLVWQVDAGWCHQLWGGLCPTRLPRQNS